MSDEDEDRRWLEAIAGRVGATDKEAAALREALLALRQGDAMTPAETEKGVQRLLERLRQERLLAQEKQSRRWFLWGAVAAGTVLVAGVVLRPFFRPSEPDEIGVRGAPAQELIDPNPAERAARLAAELEALDLTVVRREVRSGVEVEAPIGKRDDPRLAAVLSRHGLRVPESGPVLVRITAQKR